jgi:hypothetical protein
VPDTLTTISFTAPQSLLELYTQAACFIYSYKPILPDGTANPQTPAQFAMRHIIDHCSEVAQAYAAKQADAARVSAIQQIQTQVATANITMAATPSTTPA